MEYLLGVMPTLQDYKLEVHRVAHASNNIAIAEITECFERNGSHTELATLMLFDLDSEGLIRRMAVYCQEPRARLV
jgi:hypothetical protein